MTKKADGAGKEAAVEEQAGNRAGKGRAGAAALPEMLRLGMRALEATTQGVLITGRDARILWANPALSRLTGYGPQELRGETTRLFRSGLQPKAFYQEMWETILAGKNWQGELVNRRKDGGLYDEEMTITPIGSEGGEITHFVCVKQDITERKRHEKQASLLAQVVENSSELIGVGDPDGNLTYVNPAHLETLGYAKEDVIGKHFSMFLSPRNPAGLVEEIRMKTLRTGGWRGECLSVTKAGTDVPVFVSTGQIKDEHGRLVGSYGLVQDMSERKKAEETLRRSEELFRQVAENIREVFYATTPDPFRVIYLSPAYEEIWGRPREEVYERATAWTDSIHPEDRERVLRSLQHRQKGFAGDVEYRIIRPDGALRWIWSRSSPVHDAGGRLTRMVGFAEDVTDRKNADEELRGIHEKLNHALEEAGRRAGESEKLTELVDMIQCCRGVEQAYEIAREALASIFQEEAGALCITSSSRSIVEVVAAWGEAPGLEKAFEPDDCWALRRGKVHQVADAASPLRCPHVTGPLEGGYVCVPLVAQGETLGLLCLECRQSGALRGLSRRAQTVGERLSLALANLQLREVLRHQSVRDPLTGLFNRRYMEETLARELARAARRSDPVAVALCDLDHFKQFNDTFGHEAGDLVLREIANLLQLKVRAGDIACRFGGEEFLMILPDATADVARERAESIVRELHASEFALQGRALGKVGISIGVAVYPEQGSTAEDLLHAADQALYRAKREGRDRVVVG